MKSLLKVVVYWSKSGKKKSEIINSVMSVVDTLDYTEKWLKDTVTYLREARAEGSSGASFETLSHLSLNVHNQAYLRLLVWDHTSDPFPEVNSVNCVRTLFVKVFCLIKLRHVISLYVALPLFVLSADCADGPGSLPTNAAGKREISSSLLRPSYCLHYHRRV